MNRSHLIRKANTYYVRLMVPKRLQSAVGKTRLVRSLRTGDLATANRRKHAALADLHKELERAAATVTPAGLNAADVLRFAQGQRALVDAGALSDSEAAEQVELAADLFLSKAERAFGVDGEGNPKLSPVALQSIRGAYRVAHGETVAVLGDVVETYLSEKSRTLTAQTVAEKRLHLERFRGWMGQGAEVADATPAKLGAYFELMLSQPKERGGALGELKSLRTVRDDFAHVSAFFTWAVARRRYGIDRNPAAGIAATAVDSKRGDASKEPLPFTEGELLAILRGFPKSDPLWSMSALALFTGSRREEVVTWKREHVAGGFLRVTEGKTKAAVRVIPIHPAIAPLVAKLAQDTPDGYLIPGLLRTGPDAKRGKLIGKRFLYHLRKRLNVINPRVDFHSFRRSFITAALSNGVPESIAKQLAGHAKGKDVTMGYFTLTDDVAAREMRRVSFGDEVAREVERGTSAVVITMESKSRRRRKRAPAA